MNKLNETVNTASDSNAGEKYRDIRTAELLCNGATLEATVVACAIIGPKVPPLSGD